MINYFALTVTEMGIGKIELAVIGAVILIFPVLFVYASKNLDAKGVFQWMMEKPNDWICLLYTSPSPRDVEESRMPSSA